MHTVSDTGDGTSWKTKIKKAYYSTKYHMNGAMILKERESTFISLGKTAKIIPALSYGVFTSISYVSSDER